MAEAWRQTADGYQIKVEAKNQRQGTVADGLALGFVPIIFDALVTASIESPVPVDGEIHISAGSVPGAAVGDPVVIGPRPATPAQTPGNGLYGLTPGPACVSSPGLVDFILQNRTGAPIVLAADFRVRCCVLHILPAAP